MPVKDARELIARKADAHLVIELLKGKGGLTIIEASAKLLAEFVRDLPLPTKPN